MARKPTDDPIFKFLEQRHQWQRRTFSVDDTVTGAGWDAGAETDGTSYTAGNGDLYISCKYDKYGNVWEDILLSEYEDRFFNGWASEIKKWDLRLEKDIEDE